MLLRYKFVIMVRASPTAISPIRSSASPRRRALDGVLGWAWPLCRQSRRPTAEPSSLSNDHGAAVTLSLPTDPARPVAAPGS